MKSQKIKQWIKDYLDFAMPLIMVVVALNLMDSIIVGITQTHKPSMESFFTIKEHLGLFMQQVANGRLFLYSLIFVCLALSIRLFTKQLKTSLDYPFIAIWLYAMYYEFIENHHNLGIAIFMFIDGIALFVISIGLFIYFKTFFANCNHNIIKTIAYIMLFILGMIINQFHIIPLSLETKQNILTALFCFMIISILYCIINSKKITIPRDIYEYHIGTMLDLQNKVDTIKEKQRQKNKIRDLIDEYKKHR